MKVTISKLASIAVAVCLACTLFAGTAMAQDTYVISQPITAFTGDDVDAAVADQAVAAEAAGPATAGADEVLGVAITSADQLAFTGSSVNATALFGAALVGSGAVLTLAARKRRSNAGY